MDDDTPTDDDETLLDRMRDVPVGTFDPNIVGDAGPTDVPPGADEPPDPGEPRPFTVTDDDIEPLGDDEDPLAEP
ncbi:MAG TPA: hypothetical protein VFJ85_11980 [Acidimicrobiales bacterium]|nr:hypothetical protein [Acidimicrobiales bacterium]